LWSNLEPELSGTPGVGLAVGLGDGTGVDVGAGLGDAVGANVGVGLGDAIGVTVGVWLWQPASTITRIHPRNRLALTSQPSSLRTPNSERAGVAASSPPAAAVPLPVAHKGTIILPVDQHVLDHPVPTDSYSLNASSR
jgi:hypothetical protein